MGPSSSSYGEKLLRYKLLKIAETVERGIDMTARVLGTSLELPDLAMPDTDPPQYSRLCEPVSFMLKLTGLYVFGH